MPTKPSLKGCICVRVESDRIATGGRLSWLIRAQPADSRTTAVTECLTARVPRLAWRIAERPLIRRHGRFQLLQRESC